MTYKLNKPVKWIGNKDKDKYKSIGIEVSSKGDTFSKQFSAFIAKLPDGRSIEEWYQCDIKAYDPLGTNWKLGKGKKPKYNIPEKELWEMYLNLWRIWCINHPKLVLELVIKVKEHNYLLKDMFAGSNEDNVNQARALSTILNSWFYNK